MDGPRWYYVKWSKIKTYTIWIHSYAQYLKTEINEQENTVVIIQGERRGREPTRVKRSIAWWQIEAEFLVVSSMLYRSRNIMLYPWNLHNGINQWSCHLKKLQNLPEVFFFTSSSPSFHSCPTLLVSTEEQESSLKNVNQIMSLSCWPDQSQVLAMAYTPGVSWPLAASLSLSLSQPPVLPPAQQPQLLVFPCPTCQSVASCPRGFGTSSSLCRGSFPQIHGWRVLLII